jgi:predicted O-methyltransferase YrrM
VRGWPKPQRSIRTNHNLLDAIHICFDAPADERAIDRNHAMLIMSESLSAKPRRILEIGVGTTMISRLLLAAIEYNGVGTLTCVDNWNDFGGVMPSPYMGILREATVITASEKAYLDTLPNDAYDMLVSDADHSGDWCDHHFRVTSPGATLFFHDTNSPDEWPGLARTVEYVREHGWSYRHFTKISRPDERCGRGLLMVTNGKVT